MGWKRRDTPRRLAATRSRARIVVCFALLLTGCVNHVAEVKTARAPIDAGLPHPAAFNPGDPLTLEHALALANQDNEQLAYSSESYLQALIAKNLALAAFIPTVSLEPNYTIEQAPRNGTTSAGPITSAQLATAASAGGYIFSGGTFQRTEVPVVGAMTLSAPSISTLKSADQIIEEQKQFLLDAQATILLNVAQAYYQVLRSEQQVVVLQQSLAVQEARLRDAQSRFENHLALALEVSQTRALVASTSVDLTQAQSDVRNGRRTLALLMGASAVNGPLVNDVAVPDVPDDVNILVATALAHRQDLLAADAAMRASRDAVDAAFAEYYPSLSIDVSGFLYRQYYSQASKWDAILVANIPIFSAGTIEANVRTAWSRLRQAALTQSYLHRQIEQEVQNAYDNLITAQKELVNLNDEVKAAADALSQSEQLLKNGLAIPLDVLTAQQTLLNAQLLYASESFDITVFYLDLLRTTGNLNPRTPRLWLDLAPRLTTTATTVPTTTVTTVPATLP